MRHYTLNFYKINISSIFDIFDIDIEYTQLHLMDPSKHYKTV